MTSLLRIILIRIVLGGTFGTHGIPRYSNSRYCTAGAEVTVIFGTTIPSNTVNFSRYGTARPRHEDKNIFEFVVTVM